MLKAALPFTAAHFGRAILMPNLLPPVLTVKDAIAYRARVMAALPSASTFKPLLTCYLTDDTDPDDVETGSRGSGQRSKCIRQCDDQLRFGVTVSKDPPRARAHGKIGDVPHSWRRSHPEIDVFDREAVFIERRHR